KLDEARLHTKVCERYARTRGQRGHQLAEVCKGLCEVFAGDVDLGIRTLEAALTSLDVSGTVRAPTLLALIRACDEAERPELALQYMNELVTQIRSTRQRS